MEVPEIYIILICSVVAFWISKKGIPLLLLIAQKKKLFDDGNDVRKLHNGLIPTLGGVAIFTALLVTFSASSFAGEIHGFGYLVSASIILFVAGLKDDLIVISPVKKLAAQVLATALIIFGCGMQFSHMGGVFGVSAISGWVAIPLTFFTVIVVINAQNLIDGIDGLGGSIGVLASVFFGCWFYMAEVYPWAVLSFILAGSILGFLWYNRPPAQIFMGDTGSLIIGFFLAVLAINFVEYSINGPEVVYWQSASPVVVAAVLAVPLYDTLRVFIVRVVQGRSPFEADKEHVHHHLLKVGFSHGQAVVFLLTINIIIMGSVIIMSGYLSNTWLLVFLMSLSMAVFPTNQWKRRFLDVFISDRWMIKDKQKEVLEQPSPSPPSDDLLAEEKSKKREERKTLMEV